MKKILLIAFLLSPCCAFSQLSKGSILLEGSGVINFNKTENEQVSSGFSGESSSFFMSLRPQIGIFVSESFLIGAGVTYNFNSSEGESSSTFFPHATTESKGHDLLLTTYLRKYYRLNDKLYFTGTLNLMGGLGNSKTTRQEDGSPDEETGYDVYRLQANISPGLVYFVSNKWAITTSVGQLYSNFRWQNPEQDEGNKNFSADAGLNFQFNTFTVGVQYFLKNNAE